MRKRLNDEFKESTLNDLRTFKDYGRCLKGVFKEVLGHAKEDLQDWRYSMWGWMRTAVVTSVLAGAGFGFTYLITRPPSQPAPLEEYEGQSGKIRLPGCRQGGCPIKDLDRDGDADFIYNDYDDILWVDPTMVGALEEEGYYPDSRTKFMTPEIQQYATQLMRAQQRLRFYIDKEEYRLWLEE